MRVFAIRSLTTILVAASALTAQESGLRAPLSGLLIDEQSRSIRPIVGLPGSAYAGPAALEGLDFSSLAPDGHTALVRQAGALALVRALDSTPVSVNLSDATPSLAAWSEDSSTVALLAGASVSVYKDLSAAPTLAAAFDLSSIPGTVQALAVLPGGSSAFALAQADSATLYLLKAASEPRALATFDQASILLAAGNAIFVADSARHEVTRFTGWDDALLQTTVGTEALGVKGPAGLAAKANLLYVASAASRQLVAINLDTNSQAAAWDLDFTPTRLERVANSTLFLLERGLAGSAPAQLFDASSNRLFFVPVSAPQPVE